MAYKFRLGSAELSGSMTTDDIMFKEDSDTGINFESDTIKLETDGTARLTATNNGIGIGTDNPNFALHVAGEIGVDQYIRHNGDPNTHINFTDDKMVLKAGNKAMITMEEKDAAPHEVTINDGSNNIDFVVKGNGSGNGNPGMKFDASTNKLGINGIGTPDKHLHVGGSMKLDGTEPTVYFADGATEKATIGINASNNILIENKTMNKHIVFKVNDQGVVREGLRLDGAVPEVVINEQHGVGGDSSLIDLRVESDNQTHMLYVSGGADRVGIMTSTPESSFHIGGSLSLNITNFNVGNDPGSSYSCTATDCVILVNTRPTAQGGIDSTLNITLPDCASASGRVLIIKDSGGYSDQNAITISRQGSDTISGLSTSVTLNTPGELKRLISDGDSQWHEI